MNEIEFTKRHRGEWKRLETYADRLDGKGTAMGPGDLFAFLSLYRRVAGDLARARGAKMSPKLVEYLNQLVGRVHFRVYAGRAYPLHRIWEFFLSGLPRMVRRLGPYVLASAALLFVPAVAAYVAARTNPDLAAVFSPPGYIEGMERAFGESFGKEERPAAVGAFMHSFYIVNNVQVSFWAFALGVFLGLGSMYVLSVNGLILGGVGAAVLDHGLAYNFWSFVAPHGGIELGAIVLSGAAGLRIGLSFVNPGMKTRAASLVDGARDAGLVMLAVVAMLLVAAAIEAWISPSTLPNPVKLALGALNLGALLAYFGLAGREGEAPTREGRPAPR